MTCAHLALSMALTLAALTAQAGGPPPVGVTTDSAKCVKVIDGDTLDILVTYKVRVRLIDVWAPEKNTAAGEKSWEDLEHYIGGKDVILHIPSEKARSVADVITLSRVLGYVWPKGTQQSVNEWQVAKGNATKTKP